MLKRSRALILLAAITAIGAFLRFYQLGLKSLVDDEADYWIWVVQMAQGETLAPALHLNVFLFLGSIVARFASTEAEFRFIAALAGVAAIPLFFFLCAKFVKEIPSLGATLLFSLSPAIVMLSQEFREFSLTLLFTIALFLLFHKFWHSKSSFALWSLILITVLGFLTHVALAIPIAGMGLYSLFSFGRDRSLFSRPFVLSLLAYAATVLLSMVFVYLYAYAGLADFSREAFLAEGYYWNGSLASGLKLITVNTYALLTWDSFESLSLWLFLLVIGAKALFKKEAFEAQAYSLWVWFVGLVFAFLSLYPFVGAHRYNVYLLPGVFLLAALGLQKLFKLDRRLFATALLITSSFFFKDAWRQINLPGPEELRPIMTHLCENIAMGDRLFIPSDPHPQILFYWGHCAGSLDSNLVQSIEVFELDNSMSRAFAEGSSRVWIPISHMTNQERRLLFARISQITDREPQFIIEDIGSSLYLVDSAP